MKLVWLTLLLLALPAGAQVYKTVDENGRVTYTDRPSEEAEQVDIRDTNVAPPVQARPDLGREQRERAQQPQALPYEVRLSSPAPDTHLTAEQRDLHVSFAANQALAPGLHFLLLSNGSPIGGPTRDGNLTIPEIGRGEHRLVAVIADDYGDWLAESEPVTIYVHRPIAPPPKKPKGN